MSLRALYRDLTAAGITLVPNGDTLRLLHPDDVDTSPFQPRIAALKPQIMADIAASDARAAAARAHRDPSCAQEDDGGGCADDGITGAGDRGGCAVDGMADAGAGHAWAGASMAEAIEDMADTGAGALRHETGLRPGALSLAEVAALGLDPALPWVRPPLVRHDVEPSRPPAGWDGALPPGCCHRDLCPILGPCPHAATRCAGEAG